MLLGAVRAGEPRLELAVQDVVHERRFPGARDAGHHRERAKGDANVHPLEVVEARAQHGEPGVRGPPRRGHADALFPREVLARERAGVPHPCGRALVDDAPACLTAPRAELDHPVRGAHCGGIVLHHDDRVAGTGEPAEQAE